jgi:protein-L-isoaspartate(D-aspartate) O-methyltransferase
MVENQIKMRGIYSDKVLEAMMKVRRHLFVPLEKQAFAYEDRPLSIGHGQTISQPYIVALMSEAASLTGREKVLEIGTGSGYQCAVLSLLSDEVFTIERIKPLAVRAGKTLLENGFLNCKVNIGDGYRGLPADAPFDVIMLTAAPPALPEKLLTQLNEDGGRMILPLGSTIQTLLKITRNRSSYKREELCGVVFVPMLPGVADFA